MMADDEQDYAAIGKLDPGAAKMPPSIDSSRDPGQMDGKAIAECIYADRGDHSLLTFWSGVACARLLQYQAALERHGISLPRGGDFRE